MRSGENRPALFLANPLSTAWLPRWLAEWQTFVIEMTKAVMDVRISFNLLNNNMQRGNFVDSLNSTCRFAHSALRIARYDGCGLMLGAIEGTNMHITESELIILQRAYQGYGCRLLREF
jgi:hypothetical protein